MSSLSGTYRTKKQALSIADALKRAGFPNIAVIPVTKLTTTQALKWSDGRATSGKKVKMWEVRYFCDNNELGKSILE